MKNQSIESPKVMGKSRLIGLDVLKILATIFIILHHVSKHGHFYENTTGTVHVILQITNALFLPSVNIFVFISSYLIIKKGRSSFKHYLYLYAQIVFYSILAFIITCILKYNTLSIRTIVYCCLPITYSFFWYCKEYLLFYMVSPLLLKIVKSLNRKEYTITILIIFGILLYSNIMDILILPLNSGFSFVWFIVLFVIAGYQFNYGFKLRKFIFAIIFAFTSLLSIVIIKEKGLNVDYTNFITVIQTISLFNLLYDVKINNKVLTKMISYVSTCTFGIYLLHDGVFVQPVLYKHILQTNRFFNNHALLHWVVFILVIFVAGLIVDTIRKIMLKGIRLFVRKIKQRMIGDNWDFDIDQQ